ncbi:hypothetical protein [Mesorhizobium sp. M0092]
MTTPPYTDNVEMLAMKPVATSRFRLNAWPIRSPNWRFILGRG